MRIAGSLIAKATPESDNIMSGPYKISWGKVTVGGGYWVGQGSSKPLTDERWSKAMCNWAGPR